MTPSKFEQNTDLLWMPLTGGFCCKNLLCDPDKKGSPVFLEWRFLSVCYLWCSFSFFRALGNLQERTTCLTRLHAQGYSYFYKFFRLIIVTLSLFFSFQHGRVCVLKYDFSGGINRMTNICEAFSFRVADFDDACDCQAQGNGTSTVVKVAVRRNRWTHRTNGRH